MNPNNRKEALEQTRRLETARIVARCSPANRSRLEAQIEEHRNKLHQESSVQNFVQAVVKADGILNSDFKAMTVDDARRIISAFRTIYCPESLRTRAILFRMHVRWLFEVDRLDEQGSTCRDGKAIERALNVPRAKPKVVGQVITREHQEAIAASFAPEASLSPPFPVDIRNRWFTRGLKGTGHRISEFVSVRLRDIRFEMMTADVQGVPVRMEVMWVDMDERAPDLKTGARGIYTADTEAIKAAKAWLMCHPSAGLNECPKPGFVGARDTLDPDAPLNIRANSGTVKAILPNGILQIIRKACKRTGLDKQLPALLTPHDFRHTAATEDARQGSNEADLRQKFGWGPDSKMPGHYVHLRVEDMAARAIRNATVSQPVAAPAPTPANGADVSAFMDLVRKMAGQLGQDGTPASG